MFCYFKKKNIIVYFSSQKETAVITKLNCFTVLHQTNPLNKRSELATNYGGGGINADTRKRSMHPITSRMAPASMNKFKFCFNRRCGLSLMIALSVKLE